MEFVATITSEELREDSSARVWALVMYLAKNPNEQSREEFSSFWLAYVYDAEVLNGGHLQYFHNRGTEEALATISALRSIGAETQAGLLEVSLQKTQDDPVNRVGSLEEYSRLASERSFRAEDSAYYSGSRPVLELLEIHYAGLLQECISVSP